MTDDRIQSLTSPDKKNDQQAMNTAVRILTYRDHSQYELKRKLQQRGFASDVINGVIEKCERFNYIDDQKTARLYILQLKRKCFGKRYIRLALKRKRLRGDAIDRILSAEYPGVDEYVHASRILEKKKKTFAREPDPKKRSDKIYRFLYSRGFHPSVIRNYVK
ncbi:MAG: regulatory protein RecX [Desulfobacterales bacterium]|nr:regulatory protein RecX [Desulfobacterales bacterium]